MREMLLAACGTTGALLILSTLAGVFLVVAFSRLLPRARIKAVKDRIRAALYESVIFRRETGVNLRAQGKALWGATKYLCLSLPALLALALPCIFLLAYLFPVFAVRPLEQGEPLLLTVQPTDKADLFKVRLEAASPDVEITPPVRDVVEKSATWRVRARTPGAFPLQLVAPSGSVTVPLSVGAATAQPLVSVVGVDMVSKLLYPSAVAAPAWLSMLELRYPARNYTLLGINWSWLVVFFVVSLLSGMVVARVLRLRL